MEVKENNTHINIKVKKMHTLKFKMDISKLIERKFRLILTQEEEQMKKTCRKLYFLLRKINF